MNDMMLLGLDCETTGLHVDADILTIYLGVVDQEYKIIQSLDLKVKPNPDDGRSVYSVEPDALRVNKIDLLEHDKNAVTYDEASKLIYQWLQSMYQLFGKLVPFGNNVQSDIDIVNRLILRKKSWNNFVSPIVIELSTLGQFNNFLLHERKSLSLSNVAKQFGIEIDEKRLHTAEYDVILGAEVLQKYANMFACS
jgi:DNA polymerase III epsilon subunit-like protein